MANSVVSQPSTIDAKGNISVQGRSGINEKINFQTATGTPDTSAAGRALFFEVRGKFRVALDPPSSLAGDGNDVRYLVVPNTLVLLLGSAALPFVLLDETNIVDGVVIGQPMWEGTIQVRGSTTEPSVFVV